LRPVGEWLCEERGRGERRRETDEKRVVVDGFKPVREAGKPKPLSPPLAGRQAHPNITTDPASVAPMHSDEARECEKTRLSLKGGLGSYFGKMGPSTNLV
jgi:hypothetical protein